MTAYMRKSFSVYPGGNSNYDAGWDRIFGGGPKEPDPMSVRSPLAEDDKSDIRKQVEEFHRAFGVSVLDTPQVPSDDVVKLRLRLIAEEFFELLDSTGANIDTHTKDAIYGFINGYDTSVPPKDELDLVAFADALADLDYVVEGARQQFGINGKPIAAEVHRSNMSKVNPDGSVERRGDGKIIKPETYSPPDIEGCLAAQGWVLP